MEDYIHYIIYGVFGVFALIALIVKIKDLIYRSKYTSFRFINLLDYISDILSLAYFVLYFTSLYYVFKLDSLLEIIICSIVLIPVGFYLIFVKPQKEEKISKLEKEIEEKDKKIEEYENIRETNYNLVFNLLFVTSELAVLFDGITACTINFLNQVPRIVNLLLHLGMFIFYEIYMNNSCIFWKL